MDNTLEERVDRLIVKSNQRPPPNPSLRDNPDHSHNYGRPLPQQNQRPERNTAPQLPRITVDIQQNLRGPEPSATGPFRESDDSRPIQCFKCQGWGHPKQLYPSRLNYTQGGVVWEPPSPRMGRQPEGPPPSNPSPQQ